MQKIIAAGAAALFLAACGSPARIQESATSVPQRDLTLTPSTNETQVVSRIELGALPMTQKSKPSRPVIRTRVAAAAETPVAPPAPAPASAPVPESVAPTPVPTAVAEAATPDANSRELAPGATVTMIPVSTASSSPSGAGEDWSEFPSPGPGGGVTIRGWGGGHCGSGGRDHGGRGPVSILQ